MEMILKIMFFNKKQHKYFLNLSQKLKFVIFFLLFELYKCLYNYKLVKGFLNLNPYIKFF